MYCKARVLFALKDHNFRILANFADGDTRVDPVEGQIDGIAFLVGVCLHELQFKMMEVGIERFKEGEFFHGFPKVVKHLCLWVKISDAAEYVVVSLCHFSVVAASVWPKQEFDDIFFNFVMRSEKAVFCHGRGNAYIVSRSC